MKTRFFGLTLAGFVVAACGGPDFQAGDPPPVPTTSGTSTSTGPTGPSSTTVGSGGSTTGSTTVGTGGTGGTAGKGGTGGSTVEVDAGVTMTPDSGTSPDADAGTQPDAQVPTPDAGNTTDSDTGTADVRPQPTCTTVDKGYETVKTCSDGTSTTTGCDGRVYVHWTTPNATFNPISASLTVMPGTQQITMQTCHPEYVVNSMTSGTMNLHNTNPECNGTAWMTWTIGTIFILAHRPDAGYGALDCNLVFQAAENAMMAIGVPQ